MKLVWCATFVIGLGLSARAQPSPAAPSQAEKIFLGAYRGAFLGLKNGEATIRLVSENKGGSQIKARSLILKIHTDADGLMSYLIKFTKPNDIKGSAFLIREKKGAFPDQYVYLPADKKVRRLAAGKATASFFGTDFLYADLLPPPANIAEQATLTQKNDAVVSGHAAFVVDIVPQSASSPYSKLEVYIKKEPSVVLQVHYYDKENKKLKSLLVKILKRAHGQLVPKVLEMKNEQSGSRTELTIDSISENSQLSAGDFTEAAMK